MVKFRSKHNLGLCLSLGSSLISSVSLLVMDLLKFLCSCELTLVCHICLEIFLFLFDFPAYWNVRFQRMLYWSSKFLFGQFFLFCWKLYFFSVNFLSFLLSSRLVSYKAEFWAYGVCSSDWCGLYLFLWSLLEWQGRVGQRNDYGWWH